MENYELIRQDFNKIAQLPDPPAWNHNNCYFPLILSMLPPHPGLCLDIGCGQGELSQLLAQCAQQVMAVDLADKMIEYARQRYATPNIEFVCANILDMEFEDSSLDVIVSTATAHHLPFNWLLDFAAAKLRPGGILVILDLVKAESLWDKLYWGFAAVPNLILNLIKNRRPHKDDPVSAAVWKQHGEHDVYMTLREIKALTSEHLPGATVRRRLFWRYLLHWKKERESLG